MTKKLELANASGMNASSTFFGPSFQPLCKCAELGESGENWKFSRKNGEKSLKLKNEGEKRGEADRPWTCSTGQARRVSWSSVTPQTPRYCSSWRCTLLTFRMGNFCPSYPPTQQQRQTLVLALLQQSPIAGIHPRPRSREEMLSGYEIGGIRSCRCQNSKFTEISSKKQ